MRRILLIVLSFAGSAFFLWLVLRDVPLVQILDGIRQADPFWLLVNFVFVTLTLVTRGVRWSGLLEHRVPFRESFLLMSVAMMGNQLPLRAGEVARSAIVVRYNVPFFTAITSIVIERILDLLMVVLIIALALPSAPGATPEAGRASLFLGAGALVAFGVLLFFARRPDIPHGILEWLSKRIPLVERLPLRRLLDNVLQGVQPLLKPERFIHAIVWTLIAWATSVLALYALTRALNLPADKQWIVAFLGVSFTAIGLALPLSVASLGPFQAALAFVGEIVLLNSVLAVTLGFLFNGMAVLGYVFWGTIGLFMLGLSLGDLFKQKDSENPVPVTKSPL